MTVTTMIAHLGSSWLFPRQFGFRLPESKVGPTPAITTAASLRVGQILHFGLKPLLNSYFESRGAGLRGSLATLSWARFCSLGDGGESGDDFIGRQRVSKSNISGPNPLGERQWTNVLLALNVAMYIAQVATRGKLMFWGAKINGLIDDGQLWRLVTSAFLHSNIGHLLVNCYSLNAVGPSVEKISGPGRYLAVYFASAIAGSTMSYCFSNDPAVGASGAIFGLVGSTAVFIMRHRGQIGGGRGELQHIVNVIAVNMAIGLLSERIDNWGHLGGLVGGVAASWLLGPAWDSRTPSTDGRRKFADRAPIFYLINRIKRS